MRPEKVGVLMVIVLAVGLITPPVGLNVFVSARLTRAANRCSSILCIFAQTGKFP